MKTPREILLQHHRHAQPKLDSIRHVVLAAETQPGRAAVSWLDMLRSLRWHLAGMGAVWLLVLLLHADSGHAPILAAASPKPPPPQVLMAALREHRRLLSEMADAHPTDSEPRELFVPKPRSERSAEILIT